jgi:hypothetical protein
MKVESLFLALVLATSSVAADTVRILHTGGKTGTTAIITNEYATGFKKSFATVEAEGPGGCVPVLSQAQQNKTPTLIVWDSSALPNDECRAELTKHEPVATYGVYFSLCTSAENNFTMKDFLRGGSRVALSTPFPFWDQWYKSVSAATGKSYTSVPVGDSGKLVLSLVSKETDWAILNGLRANALVKDGKLKCVASTNPKGENGLPFIGSAIPNFNNGELILAWGTYVVNATPEQKAKIESTLIDIHKTAEFQQFLNKSSIVDYTLQPVAERTKFYNGMVRLMSGK